MVEALLSKWKDRLLRTFDIRMGEFRRVWLMLLNIFLLIQCLWIIKPVVNAQFLSRVGIDKLPLVFLLVAVTALAFSQAYSKLLQRKSLHAIMTRTYQVSIFCLLTFALLLQFNLFADWISYVFYIGVALFGLITTSQFWLLANLLFSSLEAKRLFGFIGAGAIAGGISGGYLTTLLAQFIDSKSILYVAAAMLLFSMILNHRIWREFLSAHMAEKPKHKTKTLQEYPLRIIRNSRHLTFLAMIIGLGVLVAKLVEFQFSAIAAQNIKDPDKLTAYFGFWLSTANAFALTIQLLFTQRMVGRLGVGRSLFILPGALLLSAAAVFKAPVLWAGTTLKVMDVSLKQSINKAATELLILPVPMSIKSQAKTYIDVFVDTTATGIGGLMLIFLINGLNFSVRAVSLLILALIGLWIYFSIRARKEYVLAFQRQLGITPEVNEKIDRSDASVAAGMRRTLKSGSVEQLLLILERIEETRDPSLMNDVIPLLTHETSRVRLAALSALYYHTNHNITKEIEPSLKDPNDQVRASAFSCLLSHTRQNRVSFINTYLTDPDPAINGAALIGLATETRANPKLQQQFNLEGRLRDRLAFVEGTGDQEEIDETKIMVVRAIGFGKLESFYQLLIELMHDANPTVARKAILAAGNTGDQRFIKIIISFLTNELLLTAAQKSVAKYKPADVLSVLSEISRNPETPLDLLVQLPALTVTMDTHHAVDFLFGLLMQHHNPILKLETMEVLHTMKTKFPNLTFTGKRILPYLMEEADLYKTTLALSYVARLINKNQKDSPEVLVAREELINLLEIKLENDLKRIFWLLGLGYPSGIILPLYKDLRKKDHEQRISIVELLDNILDTSLKNVVVPIVESAMTDKLTIEDIQRLEVNIPTELSSFESLLKGNDDDIKVAVLHLIEVLRNPTFDSLVAMAAQDEHNRVRATANRMLKRSEG